MKTYEFTRCSAREEPAGGARCYYSVALLVLVFAVAIFVMAVS